MKHKSIFQKMSASKPDTQQPATSCAMKIAVLGVGEPVLPEGCSGSLWDETGTNSSGNTKRHWWWERNGNTPQH